MKTHPFPIRRRRKNRFRFRSARAAVLQQFGDPTDIPKTLLKFLGSLQDFARRNPGASVSIFVRESGRTQRWRRNADNQKASVTKAVEALGLKVLRAFVACASGWDEDRDDFKAAVTFAKIHRCALIAESACRLLRAWNYTTREQWLVPNRHEWNRLLEDADGVPLITQLHPDTDWQDVRAHQIKRGLREKESKSGRPKTVLPGAKAERRFAMLNRVLDLRHCFGFGYRWIASETGIALQTVKNWCRRYGLGGGHFAHLELAGDVGVFEEKLERFSPPEWLRKH